MFRPILYWWLALVLILTMLDITTIHIVRSRISDAEDHALDAALVMGLIDMDASRGQLVLDEPRGQDYAKQIFKKNMGLNAAMENEFLKSTNLNITFMKSEERPTVKVRCVTKVNLMLPKLLAMQPFVLDISKSRYFTESYR